jgi:2,4-dienoyl-CoA reductase-like NADH-dependent reductase (Old Yellow Enzyme family)
VLPFDAIFRPLSFRNLTVKNRILRSNVAGRFDNYDGSGNQARINWEVKFARGGVGAIVSSFVPVQLRGRIVPNYAMIDTTATSRSGVPWARRCTGSTAASSSSSVTRDGSATCRASSIPWGSAPRSGPTRRTASRPRR